MIYYQHKKTLGKYELIAYGTFVSMNSVLDLEDVYFSQVIMGVWHVRDVPAQEVAYRWARAQCENKIEVGDLVAIYQAQVDHCFWVRPYYEFYDGRFERLSSQPGIETQKARS